MRLLLIRALAVVPLLALAAGCSSSSQSAPTPTVLAQVTGTRPAASPVLAGMLADYSRSDWSAVRNQFAQGKVGQSLIQAMTQWKSDKVPLHGRILYERHLPGNRLVATIEFYDDPRAVPAYEIYVFGVVGGRTRILSEATGITGTTYRNATWAVTRSQHFVFYHSPYQLEGSDKSVVAAFEFERNQFIHKFGRKVVPRINYYLYPRQSLMGPMTYQACGTNPDQVGCADPYGPPPTIHTVEWPSYHEPIHIFQLSLVPPQEPHCPGFKGPCVFVAPLFIAEGMAVALEDKWLDPNRSDYCSDLVYIPLDTCAYETLGTKASGILSDSGFKKADPGSAYSLGGSFVKFLILKYGYRRFGDFYYTLAAQPHDSQRDYNVATTNVFHTTITALLQSWRHRLASGHGG